jgi:hypothetical protein
MLYLGPETVVPFASILAAIVGMLLMAWRYVLGLVLRVFRRPGTGAESGASEADSERQEHKQ